jgi:tetratricopeptide (TPR) repeat protein
VYYAQQIDLEDWLLPVVYQNRPAHLTLRDLTPDESKTYYERLADLSRTAPSEPTYGFIGRDLDILRIERRLLLSRNILLVRGMGGAGKTTLLRHLAVWWRTTGLVNQAFFFSYDGHAWTRQQIMVEIAGRLLDSVAYKRDFQPLSLDAQQAFLATRLRAERHLLILDNLESISNAHLTTQHALDKAEQEALRHFLTDLVGGKTLVLLGSLGGESWLANGTFDTNVYDLNGLDPEASSTLTDLILERNNATQYRDDDNLQHLLRLLNGFPLALEVVLSSLARRTPKEVLQALQAGNVDLDTGDSEDKTRSILSCIDYSYSNLSPEAQRLLLCLAPFTSVLWLDMLSDYTNYLKQQPALADLSIDRWRNVLQEAQDWGLLSPDSAIPRLQHLHPILPYFLNTRLALPEESGVRDAINTAFRAYYDQVSQSIHVRSKNPQEQRASLYLVRLEYENLTFALNLSLKAHDSIFYPFRVLSDYLDAIMDRQRGLELGEYVLDYLKSYPSEKLNGPLSQDLAIVIDSIAMRKLQLNDYVTAETLYFQELSIWTRNTRYPKDTISRQIAHVYRQLGVIAEENIQWQQAEHYYQQARANYIDLNDRQGQARIYHNLGLLAQKQYQWRQAKDYYLQALDMKEDFDDPIRLAHTYGQIALLAYQEQDLSSAKKYFQDALRIFIDFNDFYEQAGTYLNLGPIAQAEEQWDQAERYYQWALQIYINFGHRQEQAKVYHNLGILAQKQHQLQQGKDYLLKALHLKIEFNDYLSVASTYGQLGILSHEQGDLFQAQNYLLHALEIYAEYDDGHNGVITLYNLALLWQKSGVSDVPRAIAEQLGMEVSEAETILRRMLENKGRE